MVVKRLPPEQGEVVDLTHKVTPVGDDVKAKHVWREPPPGAGRRSSRICSKCGQREAVVGRDGFCPGQHSVAVTETTHDYDPFEGE